jgi:DNA-binding transcriptional MerR regulator
MTKYSIDELCQKVNDFIKQSDDNASTEVLDKRVKDELSVRRIRDYYSKGLMSESIKEGRNAYYDDNHLKQLITLKLLQNEGITESYIKKQINIFDSVEVDQFLTGKNIIVNDKQVENVQKSKIINLQAHAYLNSPSFGFSASAEQANSIAYTQDSEHFSSLSASPLGLTTPNSNQSIGQSVNNISFNANSQNISPNDKQRQEAMDAVASLKMNQETSLYSSTLSNFKKKMVVDSQVSKVAILATEYKEYQVQEDMIFKVKSTHQALTQAQKDEVLEKIKQILNI